MPIHKSALGSRGIAAVVGTAVVAGLAFGVGPIAAHGVVNLTARWTETTTVSGSPVDGDSTPPPVISVTTPDGFSVAIWGAPGDSILMAAAHSPNSKVWGTSSVIATDGDFSTDNPASTPSAATTPDGHVIVTWISSVGGSLDQVEVSTWTESTGWSPASVLASGPALYDAGVSVGADGTAAVTWNDGNSPFALVRAAGTTNWATPLVVSPSSLLPPVTGQPSALVSHRAVELTKVSVSSAGAATVVWQEYAGQQVDGTLLYRLRASTFVEDFGGWSPPAYASPADQSVSSVMLSAGDDGSIAAAWLARGANGADSAESRIGVYGTWSTLADFGPGATSVALASGLDGAHTVVWSTASDTYNLIDSDDTPFIRAATYGSVDGWQPTEQVAAPRTAPTQLAALAGGDGTVTAAWIQHDVAGNGVAKTDLMMSALGSGWSPPMSIAGLAAGVDEVDLSMSSTGYVSAVYSQSVAASAGRSAGYSVEVLAMIRPGLIASVTPRIVGTVAVGSRLAASIGSWNQVPTSVGYQWNRDGVAIPAATSSSYVPAPTDGGHRLTVTLTAGRSGYQDGRSTSAAVLVPLLTLRNPTRPTVGGNGRTVVTAGAASWTPQPTTVRYQWLRNGKAISGATQVTYRLRPADHGTNLAVRVTADRANYASASVVSRSRAIA